MYVEMLKGKQKALALEFLYFDKLFMKTETGRGSLQQGESSVVLDTSDVLRKNSEHNKKCPSGCSQGRRYPRQKQK